MTTFLPAVSERPGFMGGDWGWFGGDHHVLTLRRPGAAGESRGTLTRVDRDQAVGFAPRARQRDQQRIRDCHDGVDHGCPAMARIARDYGYTLHINGGGTATREEAESDALSAIAFALEGDPRDYDTDAETLTLDVNVASAA